MTVYEGKPWHADEDDDAVRFHTLIGTRKMSKQKPNSDLPDELVQQVPEKLRSRFTEIVALTDRFCQAHLDAEFRDLCRDMAVGVCREGFQVTGGKAAGWAAGIVYSVAWVNFLGDPSQPHHMKAEDMARAVGVSPATLMNRAKVIREGLDLRRMDPRWSTKGMLGHNPLVWMIGVHGLSCYILLAPRLVPEEGPTSTSFTNRPLRSRGPAVGSVEQAGRRGGG